jgi:hypothetical protein
MIIVMALIKKPGAYVEEIRPGVYPVSDELLYG